MLVIGHDGKILRIFFDREGLTCGTDKQQGWFGIRATKGYILGGPVKKSVYFEALVVGTGVSRVPKLPDFLIYI
jgi:hypothetical protein